MQKTGYVYIITNQYNTTFYVGVTFNIVKRVYEHKNKLVDGFSKKYDLKKLVYFEQSDSIESAILREKFIKGKKRKYKLELIRSANPDFSDLSETIF